MAPDPPQRSAPSPATGRNLLRAILIVAVGAWIYWPALRGGWSWDDSAEITQNPVLRDPHGLARIWTGAGSPDYFPLKTSLQWLLWRCWGANPAGYHATSILLHLGSALLFWRLLHQLGLRQAWIGGLILVAHPLAVESVAWIAELKNTLSLFLLLGAMIAYLAYDSARDRPESAGDPAKPGSFRCYALSLLLFLLALLAKSTVAMLPAVILLYSWWRRGRIGRRDLAAAAPFFALSLGLGLVTLSFQSQRALVGWTIPWDGPASRVAVAGLSAAFYLGKSLWPAGLVPIYPQWNVDPPSLIQFLPWVGWMLLGGWLWRARAPGGRAVLFGLGFFLLNLLPVLGFVSMAYLHIAWVADHFAYVALLGPVALAAAGLGLLPSGVRGLAIAVVVAALGWQARLDAAHFRSEETLWNTTIARHPDSWMAHKNLGYVYYQAGRTDDAITQYETALRLKPDFPEARNNLGNVLAETGRLPEAVAQFREALRLKPGFAEAHNDLGIALYHQGDLAGALTEYAEALRLNPGLADAHSNIGNALVRQGRPEAAVAEYEKALALDPGQAEVRSNLGNALARLQRLPEAAAQYREALRLKPDLARTHNSLGLTLLLLGQPREAEEEFEAALRLEPDYAPARANLERARRSGP